MSSVVVLNPEIVAVLLILALTVYLFASDIVRVDVAALCVLVVLALSSLVPDYPGLVSSQQLFMGFSSNAVISIMAVMILGAGLDKTGLMGTIANKILQIGGETEARVITIISTTVGIISCFMQNIGAAALFLPVVSRISRHGNLPISRLLMPMGFCAILGGTITLIGSSPLILLNDLIASAQLSMPSNEGHLSSFGLFSVTPIGLVLLLFGIVYFVFLGRFVLPVIKDKPSESGSMLKYFSEAYGIDGEVFECRVTRESQLAGKTLSDINAAGRAGWIVAIRNGHELIMAPRGSTELWVGSELAIMGKPDAVKKFAKQYALRVRNEMTVFADVLSISNAGIAEVVIPPDSQMIGKSLKEVAMRQKYDATVLAVFRGDGVIDNDLSELILQSGDTLVLHARWHELAPIADSQDFVVVTDFPREDTRPEKLKWAMLFFVISLSLIMFSSLPLSASLMAGAVGMIITGVIRIDEAYQAIGWQSVFLLASLIPLGVAVQNTGTAAWIAQELLAVIGDVAPWVLQTVIAILATLFTLVMSNVGATVLLVPLAMNIAAASGADPAVFALTVALATSNSFLIPTHQVNALIMGPGGYSVGDFMKAGGIMTVMFLVITISMLNFLY